MKENKETSAATNASQPEGLRLSYIISCLLDLLQICVEPKSRQGMTVLFWVRWPVATVFKHPQELESLTEAHHRATALSKISEFSISLTLTIHCNAKLVEDLSTQKHVNHLPALISGEDWELINKFLGVYSTYNPYMVE